MSWQGKRSYQPARGTSRSTDLIAQNTLIKGRQTLPTVKRCDLDSDCDSIQSRRYRPCGQGRHLQLRGNKLLGHVKKFQRTSQEQKLPAPCRETLDPPLLFTSRPSGERKEEGRGLYNIGQINSLTDPSRSQLSPAELREVVTAFSDEGDPKAVQSTGLHIAGEKYVVLKADNKSLYGKQVRP